MPCRPRRQGRRDFGLPQLEEEEPGAADGGGADVQTNVPH